MRSLKFRAWDTVNKRFSFFKLIPLAYGQAKLIEESHQFVSATFSTEDSIITQFTGLHDKNGKEIWEGDILLWNKAEDKLDFEEEWRDQVIFDEGAFLTEKDRELLYTSYQSCEVLGNIYENKELLK